MAVLKSPVVLLKRANAPLAVLKLPSVLLKSAPAPMAVFSSAVLLRSAPAPLAVLKLPVLSTLSEKKPTAVLYVPLVRLNRAFCPSAVLPPGYPPSGGGTTACAFGKRPKQTKANVIRTGGIFVFISVEFRKNLASLSRQFAASADRAFKFQKRDQQFLRVHNETPSVAAMCVCNPDRSPARINR